MRSNDGKINARSRSALYGARRRRSAVMMILSVGATLLGLGWLVAITLSLAGVGLLIALALILAALWPRRRSAT